MTYHDANTMARIGGVVSAGAGPFSGGITPLEHSRHLGTTEPGAEPARAAAYLSVDPARSKCFVFLSGASQCDFVCIP